MFVATKDREQKRTVPNEASTRSRKRSRSPDTHNETSHDEDEESESPSLWKRDVEGDHPTLRSGKGSGKVEKGKPNPDPAVEAYLAEDANRHEDSSDSSQHPCPKKDLYRSKRLPNETNPDLPMRSNWADLSGSDTNRGFLHEERNNLWTIPGLTIGKSQILRARQEEEADRDLE